MRRVARTKEVIDTVSKLLENNALSTTTTSVATTTTSTTSSINMTIITTALLIISMLLFIRPIIQTDATEDSKCSTWNLLFNRE